MGKPVYIEGEEAEKRFEQGMKAFVRVTPSMLREHESKRSKELSQTDTKAVSKSLDRP